MTSIEAWLESLRNLSLSPGSAIRQRDRKWTVEKRKENWAASAARLFDVHLERFGKVVVEVLGERDPQFELPPEKRFAAAIYNKKPRHSQKLRKGLAETLALIGTQPDALTSCTHGMPVGVVRRAVRQILQDADAVMWASVNDCLPALAEADPDEFLSAIEQAMARHPNPFREVFAEESAGVGGRTYITGLLWGLETLAWSPSHLGRVTVLLGDLAEIDPGGNWANRPINSLRDIFLPWHPQTLADIPMRKTAIETLARERPDVAWKLLLSLVPGALGSTSGSRKPEWRDYVDADWKPEVSNVDYWMQVKNYCELLVREAVRSVSRLGELAGALANLPEPSFTAALDVFCSESVLSLNDEERHPIWESLVGLVAKHRKFSDAKWAISETFLARIDAVAVQIQPKNKILSALRLFSSREFDLYENKGSFEAQRVALGERRIRTVRDLLESDGLKTVLQLASKAEEPGLVGFALGRGSSGELDGELLPEMLMGGQSFTPAFVRGYVRARFDAGGWEWMDRLLETRWTGPQKLELLLFLPLNSANWTRAEKYCGELLGEYWARVDQYSLRESPECLEAARRLLERGRPRAAMWFLGRLLHEKIEFPPELAAAILLDQLTSAEPLGPHDRYEIEEIIKWLQSNDAVEKDVLERIEWAYLPLLTALHGGEPRSLSAKLSSSPAFFCEVLSLAYKAKGDSAPKSLTDQERRMAEAAHELLREWRRVPGDLGEKFDAEAFAAWLAEARLLCARAGRLEVAMIVLGEVLAYAPTDPGGLWINEAVASVLDDRAMDKLRSGFVTELFNRRGVHGFTAGKAEEGLAKQFHEKAAALDRRGFPRFAAAVRGLAESYARDAKGEAKKDPLED